MSVINTNVVYLGYLILSQEGTNTAWVVWTNAAAGAHFVRLKHIGTWQGGGQ
ncbi:MAG: hypothetical protein ACLQU3_03560 [Limisphaerales bacterium]